MHYHVSQLPYKCSADCNWPWKEARTAALERVGSNREERRALHFAVGTLGRPTRPPVKRRAVGLPSDPNPHRREHPLPAYKLLDGVMAHWRSAEWLRTQKDRHRLTNMAKKVKAWEDGMCEQAERASADSNAQSDCDNKTVRSVLGTMSNQ